MMLLSKRGSTNRTHQHISSTEAEDGLGHPTDLLGPGEQLRSFHDQLTRSRVYAGRDRSGSGPF